MIFTKIRKMKAHIADLEATLKRAGADIGRVMSDCSVLRVQCDYAERRNAELREQNRALELTLDAGVAQMEKTRTNFRNAAERNSRLVRDMNSVSNRLDAVIALAYVLIATGRWNAKTQALLDALPLTGLADMELSELTELIDEVDNGGEHI